MSRMSTLLAGLISRNVIMAIDIVQGYLVKGHLVSSEITQVVPAHSVDVGFANLLGKLSMVYS